jgi:hypothetical protein
MQEKGKTTKQKGELKTEADRTQTTFAKYLIGKAGSFANHNGVALIERHAYQRPPSQRGTNIRAISKSVNNIGLEAFANSESLRTTLVYAP